MKIEFENDFQKKVMLVSFAEPCLIETVEQVRQIRAAWTTALASWHSPYSALLDCTNLTITPKDDVKAELARLILYLKGFFLKNIYGYGSAADKGHELLPFELQDEQAAMERVGLSRVRRSGELADFRSLICIQNHFSQHIMELSFDSLVMINQTEQIQMIKSKMTSNLMQWHTAWNLLIDCTNLTISEELNADFQGLLGYFRAFFLKKTVGYAPPKDSIHSINYPFNTYRSRHRAVALLTEPLLTDELISGNKATCKSSSKI